jgi:hypothetical protein
MYSFKARKIRSEIESKLPDASLCLVASNTTGGSDADTERRANEALLVIAHQLREVGSMFNPENFDVEAARTVLEVSRATPLCNASICRWDGTNSDLTVLLLNFALSIEDSSRIYSKWRPRAEVRNEETCRSRFCRHWRSLQIRECCPRSNDIIWNAHWERRQSG